MTSRSKINPNAGYGTDSKYSIWRREFYPKLANYYYHFALDLDWIEWRRGRPVALFETKRVLNGRNPMDVIASVWKYQEGLELEMLATFSKGMGIPAFIIAISDPDPLVADYHTATFYVVKVNIPDVWPKEPREIVPTLVDWLSPVKTMGQMDYVEFLNRLGDFNK
jgi:hypothetical protein